jgi:hypothetical protein
MLWRRENPDRVGHQHLVFLTLAKPCTHYDIPALTDEKNMLLRLILKLRSVTQWLRHYATNRKVAGSIPDEVNF